MDRLDHRELGKQLDLFSFSEFAPGAPFWHPRGVVVLNELVSWIRAEWRKRGYLEVRLPMLLSSELWSRSGHNQAFRPNMFFSEADGKELAVKPMNCPGHCVLFAERPRSWRDLPLRYAELSPLHRNEPRGSLNGLKRARSFSQDDSHIFCREDQVEEEVLSVIAFLREAYAVLGFLKPPLVELSLRPPNAVGSDEAWQRAESALRSALDKAGLDFKASPGEGAFYGPKIDFHVEDGLGRAWQCGTVQADFVQPERFGLSFKGADNQEHRPVMLHRAVLGSFERMIAVLLEQSQGALPLWLAPEQVRVLPVAEKHGVWAHEVVKVLEGAGLRAGIDAGSARLDRRVLDAIQAKVPKIAVVGAREVAARSVSVKGREDAVALEVFVAELQDSVKARR